MKKILMTHAQKMKFCEHFGVTQATCSEVLNFKRPRCLRHAEMRNYAIKELGGKLYMD